MIALIVVCITVIVAAGLLPLRRRLLRERSARGGHGRVQPEGREGEDAAGDYARVLISAVYLALLAFLVVVLWQRIDDINTDVRNEASDLARITWIAQRLPAADQHELRGIVNQYGNAVLTTEWPPRSGSDTESDGAARALSSGERYLATPTNLGDGTTLRDQVVGYLDDLESNRSDRLANSTEGIPGVLLGAFVVLSVVALLIPYLLGPRIDAHGVVGFVVTATMVVAAVLMVWGLLHPFDGVLRVDASPVREALAQLKQLP